MLQIHVYCQNSEERVNNCHRTYFWRTCTSIQLKQKTCCVPTRFTFRSVVMMIKVMIVMTKTLRAQYKVGASCVSALQCKYTPQCSAYQEWHKITCAALSCSLVSDCATTWTVACQAPLPMGILQWLPGLPPGDLPHPGIEHRSPHCRQIVYHLSHQRRPRKNWRG